MIYIWYSWMNKNIIWKSFAFLSCCYLGFLQFWICFHTSYIFQDSIISIGFGIFLKLLVPLFVCFRRFHHSCHHHRCFFIFSRFEDWCHISHLIQVLSQLFRNISSIILFIFARSSDFSMLDSTSLSLSIV